MARKSSNIDRPNRERAVKNLSAEGKRKKANRKCCFKIRFLVKEYKND